MLLVRPARLDDAAEIAALHVAAWDGPEPSPPLEKRLELWQHVLGGGPRRAQAWVALATDGELLGFASAGRARVLKNEYDAELTAIYVTPSRRREGVGRALLAAATAWFVAEKFRTAMAWAPATGPASAFLRAVARASVLPGRRVDEIAMAWQVV